MIAPMTSEGASRTAAPRRGPGFGSRYAVATDHPLRAALLAPALRHAEEGFPVSQRLSRLMAALAEDASPQSAEARSVFLKVGAPYAPGETLRQLGLAQTLRRIAEDEREGFYGGETAGRIAREMAAAGGLIDKDDLAEQTAVWSEPIKTAYAGCEVYEQALPSQGIILLEALNIVEAFPLRDWGPGSAAPGPPAAPPPSPSGSRRLRGPSPTGGATPPTRWSKRCRWSGCYPRSTAAPPPPRSPRAARA